MNNLMMQSVQLNVPTPQHLTLSGLVNPYDFQAVIEEIDGVIKADLYANTTDTLYVPFNAKRRNEVIWSVQKVLDGRNLAYSVVGNYAPQIANWDGYKELSAEELLGTEQRIDTLRKNYTLFNSKIKEAIKLAWQMGMMFSQQREVVKHNKCGGFIGWLAAEFPDLNIKKAERFIYIYECYPNLDIMSRLEVGLTVLYKLSAPETPELARVEIEQRAEQGEKVTVAEAAEIIASHKLPDSENDLDFSEFTEADFEDLSKGDSGDKPLETGITGYSYAIGGNEVIHEATGRVLSLAQFEVIKAQKAKAKAPAKAKRKSSGGGGQRTAEQVHGDSLAAGISRGYVAQAERANGERADMVRELGKMSEDALNLLSAAIAKAIGFNDTVFNPISYIADFVMNEVSGEVQS